MKKAITLECVLIILALVLTLGSSFVRYRLLSNGSVDIIYFYALLIAITGYIWYKTKDFQNKYIRQIPIACFAISCLSGILYCYDYFSGAL